MTSPALRVGATALAAALLVGLAPLAAQAQAAKWNQDRVTGYAQELAAAAKELEETATKELLPGPAPRAAQQKAQIDFRDGVKLAANTTAHFASELAAGKDHDETAPTFRRIQLLRRDIEEATQRMVVSETLLGKVVAAGEVVLRIAPYYATE